jgi:hypothetical protein
MNELLQKELLSILQEAHLGVLDGLKFAKEKAPELINQILNYGFYMSLVSVFSAFIFLLISLFCSIFLYKNRNEFLNEGVEFVLWVGAVLSFLIFFLLGVDGIKCLLQLKTAPYLYLINYIKG